MKDIIIAINNRQFELAGQKIMAEESIAPEIFRFTYDQMIASDGQDEETYLTLLHVMHPKVPNISSLLTSADPEIALIQDPESASAELGIDEESDDSIEEVLSPETLDEMIRTASPEEIALSSDEYRTMLDQYGITEQEINTRLPEAEKYEDLDIGNEPIDLDIEEQLPQEQSPEREQAQDEQQAPSDETEEEKDKDDDKEKKKTFVDKLDKAAKSVVPGYKFISNYLKSWKEEPVVTGLKTTAVLSIFVVIFAPYAIVPFILYGASLSVGIGLAKVAPDIGKAIVSAGKGIAGLAVKIGKGIAGLATKLFNAIANGVKKIASFFSRSDEQTLENETRPDNEINRGQGREPDQQQTINPDLTTETNLATEPNQSTVEPTQQTAPDPNTEVTPNQNSPTQTLEGVPSPNNPGYTSTNQQDNSNRNQGDRPQGNQNTPPNQANQGQNPGGNVTNVENIPTPIIPGVTVDNVTNQPGGRQSPPSTPTTDNRETGRNTNNDRNV